MTITFEDHIRREYEAAFPEPIVDGLPVTPVMIFKAGYHTGLKDGQTIASDTLSLVKEQSRTVGYNAGYAQGISYCAYIASHSSTFGIDAGMPPATAATAMRDAITRALEFAAQTARERVEG